MTLLATFGPPTTAELARQARVLVDAGYPDLLGLTPAAFEAACLALDPGAAPAGVGEGDRVGMLLVAAIEAPHVEAAMARTVLGKQGGFVDFKPGGLETFRPLPDLPQPEGPVYLLFDADPGVEHVNVTPEDALPRITAAGRTPLTIAEGIALLTQFPQKLRKNQCFSLLGSRSGDKRVPAIWISQGRPKLGWCWNGNPHTWLGSASAGGRA